MRSGGIQAALGLAQLERIDDIVARKRSQFAWYEERLSDLDGVKLNAEPPHIKNNFWMVTPTWRRPDLQKEVVISRLAEMEIDSRPFLSIHWFSIPAYAQRVRKRRKLEEAKQGGVCGWSTGNQPTLRRCGLTEKARSAESGDAFRQIPYWSFVRLGTMPNAYSSR